MTRNTAWSDEEIQTAIAAYFHLLGEQQKNKPTNKAAIYRELSNIHPARSAKNRVREQLFLIVRSYCSLTLISSVNKKRGITPSTALRLAKYFSVSEDFWLSLQLRWDLYKARKTEAKDIKAIRPVAG